jgi:tail tube protein
MLKQLTVITAKVEATYNTDPVPTGAADAILVENPSWSLDSARRFERQPVKASLAPLKSLYGGSLMTISFDCEVKGSGAAGTAPEIGVLLLGCGFSETIVASTSVTYKPASSALKSITIYFYEDGLLRKITGARGNCNFSGEVGGPGKFSFSFTGHYSAPTDVALATPTFDTTVPSVWLGMSSFLVDGFAAVVTKFAFDMGNEIAKPGTIIAADGYGEIRITRRNVTGSLDPEQTLVATYNWISKWQTVATGAFATGTLGTVAGNRYAITMPALTWSSLAPGDKEGISTFEAAFEARESTADDEISLVYT